MIKKIKILNYGKEQIAKICEEIYQKRKSKNQERNFRQRATGKVDQKFISKIFEKV